jgi:hypothetical protein
VVQSGELEFIDLTDYRLQLAEAALRQTMLAVGTAVFILTAVFDRNGNIVKGRFTMFF